MDKFNLNWDEFDANIRDSFKKLREEEILCDVTLATNDGVHIQAHKIVLSTGSHFFRDIFKKSNHEKMLIYLKGISSAELEHVMDFLYNGEATINKEEFASFLETGKELQIKGLLGDLKNICENRSENPKSILQNVESNEREIEYENYETVEQESILESLEDITDSFDTSNLLKTEEGKPVLDTNRKLGLQIERMIEKNEGLWRCKVCGKTSKQKVQTQNHAETHIEGVSHVCHICSKTVTTRQYLREHISRTHSELFSCNDCGKSGMNRGAYSCHKQNYHKASSIKR